MEGLDDVETYTTGDDELDEDLQAVIDQFHVSEGDTEDETDCDAEDVSLEHGPRCWACNEAAPTDLCAPR